MGSRNSTTRYSFASTTLMNRSTKEESPPMFESNVSRALAGLTDTIPSLDASCQTTYAAKCWHMIRPNRLRAVFCSEPRFRPFGYFVKTQLHLSQVPKCFLLTVWIGLGSFPELRCKMSSPGSTSSTASPGSAGETTARGHDQSAGACQSTAARGRPAQ